MNTTIVHTTSAEVEHTLPNVLIDYLWDLATRASTKTSTFFLKKYMLEGRALQEIRYLTSSGSEGSIKVFGFDAVDTTVLIEDWNGVPHMELAGPLASIGFDSNDI